MLIEFTEIARTRGRSLSATQAQAVRRAQVKHVKSGSGLQERSGKHILSSNPTASVVNGVAVTDSDSGRGRGKDDSHEIAVVGSADTAGTSEASNEKPFSWWERAVGRKKQGIENHV